MKKDRPDVSFPVPVPKDAGNAYELVVIAALRARQLNQYPKLRDREGADNLVDQALGEAIRKRIPFLFATEEAPPPASQETIEE